MFKKLKGYNTSIGYGIDIDQRPHQIILGHGGGWYGIGCELMDSNVTFVALSNSDDNGKSGASKVIEDLEEIIAGKKIDK